MDFQTAVFELYIILQTLEEPDGDGRILSEEFGGHRVLAVMRPPPQQLQPRETVSVTPNIPM